MTFEDLIDYVRTLTHTLPSKAPKRLAKHAPVKSDFYTIVSEEINRGMGRRYALQPIDREAITFWF